MMMESVALMSGRISEQLLETESLKRQRPKARPHLQSQYCQQVSFGEQNVSQCPRTGTRNGSSGLTSDLYRLAYFV
jgi:hypothetical protein